MTILTSLSTWAHRRRAVARDAAPERGVVMHVTLEARYAASLRHALSCDCAHDAWTMRIAPLPGTQQVRLSLYLPKQQVDTAMSRIEACAPSADVQQIVELPYAPTDAWRDLAKVRASELSLRERPRTPWSPAEPAASLRELLTRERIETALDVAGRDALFSWAASRFARDTGLHAADIEAGLRERERSGSTALGHGFAIPHCRLARLHEPVAAYVRFARPVDLDAPDAQPVIDAVILLVPAWAGSLHLSLLAEIAQRFCDAEFRERLRGCATGGAIFDCLRA